MTKAPKSSWRQNLPDFLQFLDETLNYRFRARDDVLGFDLFQADFSSWKLRFSNHSPVLWVSKKTLEIEDERDLAQSLAEAIRIRKLADRNPIVCVDGRGESLKRRLQTGANAVLVLDRQDMQAIQTSTRPTNEMLERLSPQLALSLLAPYETSKPVTGSRFFGRESEIRRILQGSDTNFAIMGIRRIGKTSLLREIKRRLEEQADDSLDERAKERIVYLDCSPVNSSQEFVQEIVRKLQPRELIRIEHKHYPLYFPDFLDRMSRHYGGQLIFLLDEFDNLLTWEMAGATLLDGLRASSNSGHSRFVVAGFRDVLHASSNLDSPLFNFAKPIRLKEFTRDQTAEIVLEPLEKLNVRFERQPEVLDRIYDETGGQPNLIQFYCSILVQRLDEQRLRVISPDSLFDVYSNDDFRAFILSTFMDNTNHREKAIVFAMMADYGAEGAFGLEDIDAALQSRSIELRLEDLDRACRNLELAGTFMVRGARYRFATPIFPRVFSESYNVGYLFQKIRRESIW